MTEWRFLVDEDTDPKAGATLRDRGYDAVTVQDTVGKGTNDPDVRAYADRTDRVLITTDRGFQRPERYRDITVLMVPDDLEGPEVARRVIETVEFAATPDDLGAVTWLSTE
jgi:uncharacterized protein with PIN domain